MELFPYELTKIHDRFEKRWLYLDELERSPNSKFTEKCLTKMMQKLRIEEREAVNKFAENYRKSL